MKKITTILFFLVLSTFTVMSQDNYSELKKICASDREQSDNFGAAIEADGDWAVVGAPYEDHDLNNSNYLEDAGSAYILKKVDGNWVEFQKIIASDRTALDNFGYSVAIAGDYIVVGSPMEDEDASGANTVGQAGSVYVFHYDGTNWVEQQKLVSSNRISDREFGTEVAVGMVNVSSPSVPTVSVGTSFNNEAVYVFEYSAGTWSQVTTLNATNQEMNDYFGSSISISGTYMAVGCPGDKQDLAEANPIDNAGSVYIFRRTVSGWSLDEKVISSTRAAYDDFGTRVDLNIYDLIVGVPYDDTDENGLNSIMNAGAAFIFTYSSGNWVLKNKLVNSDRASNDAFGTDVSINGYYASVTAKFEDEDENGNNTVGSAGSSYIFYNNLGNWEENQKIVASNRVLNGFGKQTSMVDNFIFVTSENNRYNEYEQDVQTDAGAVYVFTSNLFATEQPISITNVCLNNTYSLVYKTKNNDNKLWYVSTDSGSTFNFIQASQNPPYDGFNQDTLFITPDVSMNGYLFYCKAMKGSGYICSDTVVHSFPRRRAG